MIAIVDTGGANIASVFNAFQRLQRPAQLTREPDIIRSATHVILPGVGAAKDSMQRITTVQLVDIIKNLQQPVLGICLGMQLLFSGSEEGDTACLDIIPGQVRRFASRPDLVVPHMGWNTIALSNPAHPLFADISQDSYFYFVHSYKADENAATIATCTYGQTFTAAVQKDNFFGVQFHPERSAGAGAQLLRNFLQL